VEGDAFTTPFSAPSAEPPPCHLYRFTFRDAFGVTTSVLGPSPMIAIAVDLLASDHGNVLI
jgi:hypothetical protein